MITYFEIRHNSLSYRILSAFIAFTFIFSLVLPPGYAQLIPQTLLNLPAPGMMVTPTSGFTPAMVTGITIHPENPLQFDFIVNTGDLKLVGQELTKEANKLIKYFLAALTVPEKELWVNLSPYEKDRIIPPGFGNTEMGRDLLAQDYILKQLTASLMYPEKELGKKFWDKIYKQAREKYGTTEIPMDTFNKVWIVPEDAVIYEQDNSAFVVKSRLKVMLEEDYKAMGHNVTRSQGHNDTGDVVTGDVVTTSIIREVILPEIEKEVNTGETFASLRQIYNSTILAAWYKMTLKESLLGQVYVDQNKTRGIDTQDKQVNEKIYNQYLEAFKKGVYNYIKEDYDEAAQEVIPRKYFSGGAYLGTGGTSTNPKGVMSRIRQKANKTLAVVLLAGSLAGGVSQSDAQAMVASGLKGLNGSSYVQVEANLQEFGPQANSGKFNELYAQISGGAVFNPSAPASSPMGVATGMMGDEDGKEALMAFVEKTLAEDSAGYLFTKDVIRGLTHILIQRKHETPETLETLLSAIKFIVDEYSDVVLFSPADLNTAMKNVKNRYDSQYLETVRQLFEKIGKKAPDGEFTETFEQFTDIIESYLRSSGSSSPVGMSLSPEDEGLLDNVWKKLKEGHVIGVGERSEEAKRFVGRAHREIRRWGGKKPAYDVTYSFGNVPYFLYTPAWEAEDGWVADGDEASLEMESRFGMRTFLTADKKQLFIAMPEDPSDVLGGRKDISLSTHELWRSAVSPLMVQIVLGDEKEDSVKVGIVANVRQQGEQSGTIPVSSPVSKEEGARRINNLFDVLREMVEFRIPEDWVGLFEGKGVDYRWYAEGIEIYGDEFFEPGENIVLWLGDSRAVVVTKDNLQNMTRDLIERDPDTAENFLEEMEAAVAHFQTRALIRDRIDSLVEQQEELKQRITTAREVITDIDGEIKELSREESGELRKKTEDWNKAIKEMSGLAADLRDIEKDLAEIKKQSEPSASSPVGASEDADGIIDRMVDHSQAPGSPAAELLKREPDYSRGVEKISTDQEIISDNRVPVSSPAGVHGPEEEVGGIDLNPALLDLQIRRDGNGVPLPLPMQPIEHMHIEGFLPIIINVTPITNLPMLLGLADTEQDADEITPAMKAREPEEISALN